MSEIPPRELHLLDLHAALRHAGAAYDRKRFVVVGSAALIGSLPEAAASLRYTVDVDLFPMRELCEQGMCDGDPRVGQLSDFHQKHGFYIERLGDWVLMTAPKDWMDRATRIESDGVTGWCLSPLDLAYIKTEAGRSKDINWVASLIDGGYLALDEVRSFIEEKCPFPELLSSVLDNLANVETTLAAAQSQA